MEGPPGAQLENKSCKRLLTATIRHRRRGHPINKHSYANLHIESAEETSYGKASRRSTASSRGGAARKITAALVFHQLAGEQMKPNDGPGS
ncbi:hypothetical protein CMQ_914 [Grosmannia clavigera kw1407]|uniref:Uncharacterized protein n=1 Tax=Grosmannia clavigera (strain kw1407 / UAMH 11150) TaxID=655863 RepID=F0XD67_GROCL|nr:uncharacterized protein CMQ_914 [Grosmannia clavigera kw1407]EFX03986.1 hypothetical protein CMQ_914 [Grosmannia clavigera kw1407]